MTQTSSASSADYIHFTLIPTADVFVRNVAISGGLQLLYDGPIPVLKREKLNHFNASDRDCPNIISVDCFKRPFLLHFY